MKARLTLPFALICILINTTGLAGTAQVQVANKSLLIHPGSHSPGFGMVWYIHFSSWYTEDPAQANNELYPRSPGSPTTHWAYMLLYDPSMYAATTLVEVDLPLKEDLDRDGMPDLLDPAQEVRIASSGVYYSDLGEGTLSMSWQKQAGSRTGTCTLYLDDPILGRMGPFVHFFETFQYKGGLTYDKTQNQSRGKIDLKLGPVTAWTGDLELTRLAADPCNVMTVKPGIWTNEYGHSFEFGETTLHRDKTLPSVYTGTLRNPVASFGSWMLHIVDSTDSNHNGIPDLSDDLIVQPPAPAHLSLNKKDGKLQLLISGESGRSYDIETTTALGGAWQITTTVTLTNASQTVDLTTPANGARYWRVVTR